MRSLGFGGARPTVYTARLLDRVFGEAESETVVDTYVHVLPAEAGPGCDQHGAWAGLPVGDVMSGRLIGDEVLVRRAARGVAVQAAALVAVAMLLLIALVTLVFVRGQTGAADDLLRSAIATADDVGGSACRHLVGDDQSVGRGRVAGAAGRAGCPSLRSCERTPRLRSS